MTNHWPLLASSAMICTAAALGIWQQETNSSSAAAPPPEAVRAAEPAPPAPAVVAATPAPEVPAPQIVVAPPPPISAGRRTDIQPSGPRPIADPTAPLGAADNPIINANRGGLGMDFNAGKSTRDQAFQELRAALQAKVTGTTLELPGGGYAFVPTGARMEVQPQPGLDWRISLYNINGRTPEVESESFKSCLAAIASTFAIDMTVKPIDRGDGRTTLKTGSKLGRISLDRDVDNTLRYIITPTLSQKIKTAGPQPAPPMNTPPPANNVPPVPPVPPVQKNVGEPTF